MHDLGVWWQKNTIEFARFKNELIEFKTLRFEVQESTIVVLGQWEVFGEKHFITSYDIRIHIPNNFPNSPPIVYEIGGKIKKHKNLHINEDHSACIFSPPERYEKWPIGSGIRAFLNGPMKEFFFSQAYYALTGNWPFGEWSHGNRGILEYYANLLKTDKILIIGALLQFSLYAKKKSYQRWRCPCQSKKTVAVCHSKEIDFLSKIIPKQEILIAIEIVQTEIYTSNEKTQV